MVSLKNTIEKGLELSELDIQTLQKIINKTLKEKNTSLDIYFHLGNKTEVLDIYRNYNRIQLFNPEGIRCLYTNGELLLTSLNYENERKNISGALIDTRKYLKKLESRDIFKDFKFNSYDSEVLTYAINNKEEVVNKIISHISDENENERILDIKPLLEKFRKECPYYVQIKINSEEIEIKVSYHLIDSSKFAQGGEFYLRYDLNDLKDLQEFIEQLP